MKASSLWSCCALAATLCVGMPSLDVTLAEIGTELRSQGRGQSSSLAVTYIANEGFMIECSARKILVDALFTESPQWPGVYAVPSDALLEQMESALRPRP